MKYRLIVCSNESGTDETVYFLDAEDDDEAVNCCHPGQTVSFDKVIEADLPSIFPIDSALQRE